MTVKVQAIAPMPPHVNPQLRQGQTYRIIGARTGAYQDHIGRYFLAAFCAGRQHIVYMDDTHNTGGYDTVEVLSTHGIEFVVVNLQEV